MKKIILILTISLNALLNAAAANNQEEVIKYILTGGPGVGKTSIIKELKKRGYQVAPEAYETLFYENKISQDQIELRTQLVAKQNELEDKLTQDKPAFLDRCMIDILLFGKYYGVKLPQVLIDQAKKSKYQIVFLIEPLHKKESYEKNEYRLEEFEEAQKIHEFLAHGFKDLGYKILAVPFDTIGKRADFILSNLKL